MMARPGESPAGPTASVFDGLGTMTRHALHGGKQIPHTENSSCSHSSVMLDSIGGDPVLQVCREGAVAVR